MKKVAILLTASCISLPAFADPISIEFDKSVGRLVIDISNTKIDEVLNKIAPAQGIEVVRAPTSEGSVVSGQYEGSVHNVILDILARENHMIFYSGPSGDISRIYLYGMSKFGPLPTAQERQTFSAAQPANAGQAGAPQPISGFAPPAAPLPPVPATGPSPAAAVQLRTLKQTSQQKQTAPQPKQPAAQPSRKLRGGGVN